MKKLNEEGRRKSRRKLNVDMPACLATLKKQYKKMKKLRRKLTMWSGASSEDIKNNHAGAVILARYSTM